MCFTVPEAVAATKGPRELRTDADLWNPYENAFKAILTYIDDPSTHVYATPNHDRQDYGP